MMTHFQHLNTHKRILRAIGFLTPFAIGVLLFVVQVSVPERAVRMIHAMGTPVWYVYDTYTTFANGVKVLMSSKATLVQENEALRIQENMHDRADVQIRLLEKENSTLRKALFQSESQGKILGTVRYPTQTHSSDIFLLDIGDADGVREDMLVETADGYAIGTIAFVTPQTSVVRLFSSIDTAIPAVLVGTSTIHIEVKGRGAQTMVSMVPRDIAVAAGDSVLLPFADTPMLGHVVSVEVAQEDAFQTVYIRGEQNPYTLRFVYVDTVVDITEKTLEAYLLEEAVEQATSSTHNM